MDSKRPSFSVVAIVNKAILVLAIYMLVGMGAMAIRELDGPVQVVAAVVLVAVTVAGSVWIIRSLKHGRAKLMGALPRLRAGLPRSIE
jgi:hypothetical protein